MGVFWHWAKACTLTVCIWVPYFWWHIYKRKMHNSTGQGIPKPEKPGEFCILPGLRDHFQDWRKTEWIYTQLTRIQICGILCSVKRIQFCAAAHNSCSPKLRKKSSLRGQMQNFSLFVSVELVCFGFPRFLGMFSKVKTMQWHLCAHWCRHRIIKALKTGFASTKPGVLALHFGLDHHGVVQGLWLTPLGVRWTTINNYIWRWPTAPVHVRKCLCNASVWSSHCCSVVSVCCNVSHCLQVRYEYKWDYLTRGKLRDTSAVLTARCACRACLMDEVGTIK